MHISLWRHLRQAALQALKNISWGRDMVIATCIAVATAGVQLKWALLPAEHKWLLIVSIVAPYGVVLGAHALWRVLIVGPYELHNVALGKLADAEASAQRAEKALDDERARTQQPDVALVWDWSEDQKKLGARWETEKQIIVHNRSNEYIYNVQIEPINLWQELSFDLIKDVAPNTEHVACARWGDMSSESYGDFFSVGSAEAAAKGWRKTKAHDRGISSTFLEIPMAVTYEAKGIKWRVEFDFNYDDVGSSVLIRKSGGRL